MAIKTRDKTKTHTNTGIDTQTSAINIYGKNMSCKLFQIFKVSRRIYNISVLYAILYIYNKCIIYKCYEWGSCMTVIYNNIDSGSSINFCQTVQKNTHVSSFSFWFSVCICTFYTYMYMYITYIQRRVQVQKHCSVTRCRASTEFVSFLEFSFINRIGITQ